MPSVPEESAMTSRDLSKSIQISVRLQSLELGTSALMLHLSQLSASY